MTEATYKPAGRPDVSVYMVAKDAAGTIRFMQQVLGAGEVLRHERPDGSLMHGEYRIGDSLVMISQATPEFPAFPVWLHVYVPDVESVYRLAISFGSKSVQEPKRGGDGDYRAGVTDPAGNTWWISTHEPEA